MLFDLAGTGRFPENPGRGALSWKPTSCYALWFFCGTLRQAWQEYNDVYQSRLYYSTIKVTV